MPDDRVSASERRTEALRALLAGQRRRRRAYVARLDATGSPRWLEAVKRIDGLIAETCSELGIDPADDEK